MDGLRFGYYFVSFLEYFTVLKIIVHTYQIKNNSSCGPADVKLRHITEKTKQNKTVHAYYSALLCSHIDTHTTLAEGRGNTDE